MQSDYHLVLAQELKREAYTGTYEAAEGDAYFIILDNGAAEGQQVSNDHLMAEAVRLNVDEVVMPDVMNDAAGTLEKINEFTYDLAESDHDLSGVQLMAVVQGQTFVEVFDFIRTIERHGPAGTLGIPRHLLTTLDSVHARGRIAAFIEEEFGTERFDIHFLGTNPLWPAEVKFLGVNFPWARGVDSSVAYNYTMAGKFLGKGVRDIGRPDGYFTDMKLLDHKLLQDNINIYKEWASGTEGTRS